MELVGGSLVKIFMKELGNLIDLKGKGKFTQMHLIMKETLKMDISMEEAYKYLQMAIGIKDCMQMENLKVMAHIRGRMEHYTKASSKMVLGMAMVPGHMEMKAIKAIILMIKGMVEAFTSGVHKAITKANF